MGIVRGFTLAAALLALPAAAHAQFSSTTTTTTLFTGTTTTTMFTPVDVSSGGDFEGSFPAGSFDEYTFTLDAPRVLVAETTNGFGGCPGDTIVELLHPGAPSNCAGQYGDDLPCMAFDDDSGIALCSRLVHRILQPGTYLIRVSVYGGGKLNRYFLHVEFDEEQCGNGKVEITEQCDDGNLADGDCCSSSCMFDANGAFCDDGLFCDGTDSCDGAGHCSKHSGQICPGPDGDANCAESCSDAAGGCTGPDPNGSPCDDGIFCNGTDTCLNGTCSVHSGNPCAGPDGDSNCSESCSELNKTCTAPDPDGSVCNDGVFCNGSDHCLGGACNVHSGNPCPGPDGDGNCSESCNEGNNTCTAPDPDGAACNDGLFCNGTDSCHSGSCSAHSGSPCPGPDGDANCAESCNEQGKTCNAPDPNGSPCEDGLFCDGTDTCQSGHCSAHSGNPCPGPDGDANCSETCSEPLKSCEGADANGSPCNDGIFCNGTDSCLNGSCSVHSGNPCPGPDGDANCSETCNEQTAACTAPDPDGSPCSDGSFCDGADSCSGGACSIHAGNPCPGPDGDANCSESCDENKHACTAPDPDGSACDDGLFCDGTDTCAGGNCSQHSAPACPGPDGDSDCSESCSDSAAGCTGPDPNGSPCDDGIFCNGADFCQNGACSGHAGSPCPGADGDGNCSESCNENTKACDAPDPDGSACDDGVFCNGADSCDGGLCGFHPGDPCPGPNGDGNCSQSCNEQAKACEGPDPDGSACDDAVFCNGADTCSGGACSVHAGDPCPGPDGDGNCAESCDEQAKACDAPDAFGSWCDDGNPCTVTSSCDGDGNCAGGAPTNCNDNDDCTTDACTNGGLGCSHTPIPNCPAVTCGDVNGDSSIKASDALSILKAAVGGTQCQGKVCVCDVNSSGTLTASDALLVLKFSVGIQVTLACNC
jgi:hypothetical protein